MSEIPFDSVDARATREIRDCGCVLWTNGDVIVRWNRCQEHKRYNCVVCDAPITATQAVLSASRADGALPTCKDCVSAELTGRLDID